MGVALGRLSLRRMRNGSRHGGRYTEHRESREKGSLRIGAGPDAGIDPLSLNPQTPFLMKAEHNQSCLPSPDQRYRPATDIGQLEK